jgi:hypothetical protein
MNAAIQQTLSPDQIAEFYHDVFVQDQVADFVSLIGGDAASGVAVDIGGGCGFFVERLRATTGQAVRVIDMDPASVAACEARSIPAELGDALKPPVAGDEACISFNLILHHLVASDDAATTRLQEQALLAWKDRGVPIFVNEYIYESFVGQLSPRLIFAITSSKSLSLAGRAISRVIPAFRANTFGVGVRFRSHGDWLALFNRLGFEVVGHRVGEDEVIKLPLRLMLIKAIRRNSYRLRPVGALANA